MSITLLDTLKVYNIYMWLNEVDWAINSVDRNSLHAFSLNVWDWFRYDWQCLFDRVISVSLATQK